MIEKELTWEEVRKSLNITPEQEEEIKLEIFPPGHDATRIIPRAIIGVIRGFNAKARRKVTNGRHTH